MHRLAAAIIAALLVTAALVALHSQARPNSRQSDASRFEAASRILNSH